ncbi:MAG: hypothetical protein ABFD82_02780 [Syntrophaceae bacterium]
MEDHSQMRERIRLPLVIPIHPYLHDHHFEGKIILPAAEILQRLAGSLREHRPDALVRCMRSASFDRFLQIPEDSAVIEPIHELEVYESGRIHSQLITVSRIRSTMTRTKVHAVVDFAAVEENGSGLAGDMLSESVGGNFIISSQRLYSDLVPFGPSYQNVRGEIVLSEYGAVARVHAVECPALSEPLGSPFPFDGALHIACAWGQRYHNIVAFPIGFEERIIASPTIPGETYICRVAPVSFTGEVLRFDIYIHNSTGSLCEAIRGVIMRDVSGGRVKPPGWVLHRPI